MLYIIYSISINSLYVLSLYYILCTIYYMPYNNIRCTLPITCTAGFTLELLIVGSCRLGTNKYKPIRYRTFAYFR